MKLKDILAQLKYQIKPDAKAIHDDVISRVYSEQTHRQKSLISWISGGVAALLIIAGLTLYSVNYYKFDASNNITGDISALSPIVYVAADSASDGIVSNNTTVSIVTKESMSAAKLSKCVNVTPEIPFSVKKKGTNRFTLVFDETLENNTSYTIGSLSEGRTLYRWSLQTESSFAVTNAYPAESEVDVNTSIEVTFSESNVNSFSEYFTIQPHVDGTFKHNGRTWIFLPTEPLTPYTVYNVTVSKDIAGHNETVLGEDYAFSFTTGASESKWAYVTNETFDIADTFASTSSPYVTIYANGMGSATADMTVYKLTDDKSYLTLHSKYSKNAIISSAIAQDIADSGLEAHSKFSVSAIPDPENDQQFYFNYPKELEPGYYVTEINWNGVRLYQLLQISDLSVYAAAHDGTYVVWVNSVQTGTPISDAVVSINSTDVKTDKDGIATLQPKLSDETDPYIVINSESLLPHIIHAQNSTDQSPAALSDYYSYLYTNSSIYHTTDTVKLWGVVLKRNQSAKAPTVTVYAAWNDVEYPVTLSSNGSFSLEIPIEKFKLSQSSELILRVNGYDHYYKYLNVVDYKLPAYSLSLQADKNAYFAGEGANLTINAEFYDGTPATNLLLTDNKELSLITDKYGKAAHSIVTAIDPEIYEYSLSSCVPQSAWQYVQTDETEGDTAFAETPILVFGNNEFLRADISKDGNRYTLDIKTNKIVTDRINELSYAEFLRKYNDLQTEYYLGDTVDKEITLEVHEITYERNKIGSYYDPIQKKLQLQYEYIEKDNVIKSDTFSTKDGIATLQDYAIPSSEGSRYVKFKMKDASDRDCFVIIYIDHISEDGADHYCFTGIDNVANENDQFSLGIYNPTTKQHLEGSFIYLAIGDNYFESNVSEDGKAKFVFNNKCSPDVTLFGAYYDGSVLHNVIPHNVATDLTPKNINVKINSDKANYAPGETVTLEIETTNAEGDPVSTDINVNVMDRALLDLFSNDSNVLDSLYLSRAPVDIYTSLPVLYYGEGGGSGEPSRTDFEDTPAFLCEETNKDGKATITFTLPDSLTSWVISVRAVTDDVKAGDNQIEVVTTKDLFATAQIADTIKTTDDAVIAFRCDGNALNTETPLQSTITIVSDTGEIKTQTLSPIANTLQYVNFGKLQSGTYTVQIEVAADKFSDRIERQFDVAESNLSVNTISELTDDLDGITDLIITDSQYSKYTEIIDALTSVGSSRIDHVIGEKYVEMQGEAIDTDTESNVDWFFMNEYVIGGGFSPYKGNTREDLFLTARIASLFPDKIDREYVLWYLDNVMSNEAATMDDIICALWTKSALHEAVEKDLAYYYADGNVFTVEQQLYFALAFAYSGNQTMANEIYNKHISPKLVRGLDEVYLQDEDQVIMDRCNSMLLMLTARISSKDTDKTLNYLSKHDSDTILISLEYIAYLKEYTPLLEGKNSVRITLGDNVVKEISYNRFVPFRMRIEADKASKIKVESVKGESIVQAEASLNGNTIIQKGTKLGVIACYRAPEASLGDHYPITLSIDPATVTSNKINLVLPAGIRYLGSYTTGNDQAYVVTSADPDVLTIYFSGQSITDITLNCKATLPGVFIFEPMLGITDSDLSYYATDPFAVTIIDPETIPTDGETGPEIGTESTESLVEDPIANDNTALPEQPETPAIQETIT